jgi:protein SCO1
VRLAQYFSTKRPVLLNLVYYDCPSLCGFVLKGFLDGLKPLSWTPGREFEIVTVSINPREKPQLAAKKKAAYLQELGRPGAEQGWHFLTGDEAQIQKLAAQVGFRYKWIEKDQQYSHSAAIFVLTPQGRISRYLYGVLFPERDLKLALLEASDGKIGTLVERFLLFCYRYDPQTRKYSIYLTQLMRLAALLTTLALGGYLALFWRRERKLKLPPMTNPQESTTHV